MEPQKTEKTSTHSPTLHAYYPKSVYRIKNWKFRWNAIFVETELKMEKDESIARVFV